MKKKLNKFKEAKEKNIVLYLDKIVYPDTYEDIIKKVLSSKPENCNIKFVAFVPE